MPRQDIEIYLKFVASKCNPPFSEKETKAKIKSAFKRTERKKIALTAEIKEFVSVTNGYFSVTEAYQSITSVTPKDRAKVRVVLNRLVKDGVLERHGNRDGIFRRVENETEAIDFMTAEAACLPIRWPFAIEKLVEIMPGNLCIVAGDVEAGKTAFLLNLAKFNMHEMETHYFSSEMAGGEMRKRLQKFDDIILSEWNFKAHARAGAFHDVIVPDALNIVDFIEVFDEFYKIGHYLKRIHDKLDKGIAVVALQKPKGRDEGLGGQRSMEVARLYLSLSQEYPGGRIKISKGKNWATDRNPNGLSIKYKIVNGAQMYQEGDWARV
jgi:archaellum biogenesis ATPase FlaH